MQCAALVAVGILLIIQSVVATHVGIETGHAAEQAASYDTRE